MIGKNDIKKAFNVSGLAISDEMIGLQERYRAIVRGRAEWNDKDTPSLMLAGSISAEVARKVTVGLESEVFGGERKTQNEQGTPRSETLSNARSEYLEEQYTKVREILRAAVISACNGGEIILKPYMVPDALEVTLVETDCYWPIEYNTRDELVDVIFAEMLERGEYTYKLLERHRYDEAARAQEITYRAFRSRREASPGADNLGDAIPLTDVPEWAHLRDITIAPLGQSLFAHFKLPNTDSVETPQRQGLPIWSKAVEMLRKADQQEARTDWEFEGGELAIDAPIDWFKKDSQGKPILPARKERLFRAFDNKEGQAATATPYNPEFRIDGLDKRMNQILRRIEFLSGLSYGILSDANVQDKTATEILASKDRFFTTVSDIQQALQKTLEHLIASLDALADIQGIPSGAYEVSFTWDDSIMADREREFDERMKLQNAGILSPIENRAWWLNVDVNSEQAQNLPEPLEDEF